MELITTVKEAWAWTGLEPDQVVGDNDFGHLIVKDLSARYWHLCPDGLSCRIIANSRPELDALSRDQDFLRDWYMRALVQEARDRLGPLRPGFKYCLKIPGTLDGQYGGENLGVISPDELISASGGIARQIADLPDGSRVRLNVVD